MDRDEREACRAADQILAGRGIVRLRGGQRPFVSRSDHVPGLPLPPPIRAFMEARFGCSLGHVRLHTGPAAARCARLLNADAFTIGPHIFFAAGRYAPQAIDGRWLLAHELAHVIQQEADGILRIQCFEAAVHESIEQFALTSGKQKMTSDEARAVYFGNWMRDFNQVFVPLVFSIANASGVISPFLEYDNLFLMINRMAYTKFHRYLTHEQFGYYIPAEHIDSPVGLVHKHDLLPRQPMLSSSSLNPASAARFKPRPTPLDTPQDKVAPGSIVSKKNPRVSGRIFSADQTATAGFMRRTNVHIERRLQLAVSRGRNPDGMMHLGAALHAIEDLFAHSNWIEIAINKLLKDDPQLLQGLTGQARHVFTYSPQVGTGEKKQYLMTTGSFSTTDTVISLHSEVVNLLAKGPPKFRTNEEKKAEERFMENMLRSFSDKFRKNGKFRAAIQQTTFYKTVDEWRKKWYLPVGSTDWLFENLHYLVYRILPRLPDRVRKPIHNAIAFFKEKAMRKFSAILLAYGVRNSISDTSQIKNLRDCMKKAQTKKLSDQEKAALVRQAEWVGKKAGTLINEKIVEATDRAANLRQTPATLVAGPSHSQLSKDHINSIFFGLSFYLAAIAVEMVKDKMLAAWAEQNIAYKRAYTFKSPETDKDLRAAAAKAGQRATRIIKYGGDIPASYYDLAGNRRDSAKAVRSTAALLEKIAASPMTTAAKLQLVSKHIEGLMNDKYGPHASSGVIDYLLQIAAVELQGAARVSRKASQSTVSERKTLRDTARELRLTARLIGSAATHKQRESANKQLKTVRNNTLKRLLQSQKFDTSFYSAILLAIDLHITTTAVAYTEEQRAVLEGQKKLSEASLSVPASTINLPAVPQNRKAYKEMIDLVRAIFNHPAQNNWWEAPMKVFIQGFEKQMVWEISARNEGVPVYKIPSQKVYQALVKKRPV